MHRTSKSISRVVLVLSALGVFLMPGINFACHNSLAQSSCEQSCDGLPGLPPQSPPGRSFDQFIQQAYGGAYGRLATCVERHAEYSSLFNAAGGGALLVEARRFVATLFMTQASYDVQDLTTYLQTAEYQVRNPQDHTDRASIESFIADLYRAFLQREPDLGGQCFWSNDVCSAGRKHGIKAFEESIEFGNLVNGLFDDGPPPNCPPPDDEDPCLRSPRKPGCLPGD
jgi:hypothetical protein